MLMSVSRRRQHGTPVMEWQSNMREYINPGHSCEKQSVHSRKLLCRIATGRQLGGGRVRRNDGTSGRVQRCSGPPRKNVHRRGRIIRAGQEAAHLERVDKARRGVEVRRGGCDGTGRHERQATARGVYAPPCLRCIHFQCRSCFMQGRVGPPRHLRKRGFVRRWEGWRGGLS